MIVELEVPRSTYLFILIRILINRCYAQPQPPYQKVSLGVITDALQTVVRSAVPVVLVECLEVDPFYAAIRITSCTPPMRADPKSFN